MISSVTLLSSKSSWYSAQLQVIGPKSFRWLEAIFAKFAMQNNLQVHLLAYTSLWGKLENLDTYGGSENLSVHLEP